MAAPEIRRLLSNIIQPYRRQLSMGLLLAVAAAVVMVVQYALLAHLFATWLDFAVAGAGDYGGVLWRILPWLVVCFALRHGLDYVRNVSLQRVSLQAREALRVRLLTALAVLGPARRYLGSDGSLSSQVLEQVDALDGYVSRYYVQKQLVAVVPLMLICATYYYSPLAAGLLLLTAPLVPVFMILVGQAAAKRNRAQFRALAQLSGRFLDLLRGMATLQRLQAGDQAQRTIDRAAHDYQQRTMSVLRLAFLSTAVLELFASLAIALVAVYLGLGLLGVLPWAKGVVPVPFEGALFILLLAPEFYQPLRQLGADYHDKAKAEAAVEALLPLLSVSTEVDTQAVVTLTDAPALTLQHVAVQGDDARLCLAPLDMQIKAGDRVAVVGVSGSGKSTLLQTLLGFRAYDGVIQVDGVPCAVFNQAVWYRQIGYLAQQPPLLAGSIGANLRLARADADDMTLQHVLQQVGLWSLVSRLPDGLDTLLGEQGRGLSGGQLQRLGIAQLLLRNTPLWLLDEPVAHLDPQSAAEIMALLGTLSVGKTVLLASHDALDVDWVDWVCTLEAAHATT